MNNAQKQTLLQDLFSAYYKARKNKRHTENALRFELNFESRIFKLWEDILSKTYSISRSICFISFYPVRREIFAGDFRDRVVHHLIFDYLSPICERVFIHDSYSCRTGKGTSYGIKRIDKFIRSCSENYTKDCYILKLDISGYFMSMNKKTLYSKVAKIATKHKKDIPLPIDLVLYIVRIIIFHDPTKKCRVKGKRDDWIGLPKSKSLFFADSDKGLPIGNLTSQLFGNVYLNDFDHFMKEKLGCRHYGRYVDDFFVIHHDKKYLQSIIPLISDFLKKDTGLSIHPKKIYLQHYKKGVSFLGVVTKPYRKYISSRTKGNFYSAIDTWAKTFALSTEDDWNELKNQFESVICSYLGIIQHYNSFRLLSKIKFKLNTFPEIARLQKRKSSSFAFLHLFLR